MSAADRITDTLLRLAARRWSAELRDELAREWAAEVHALRTDPSAGAARRATGQLRFAFSLATRSTVDDAHGMPHGWREGLPGAGQALQPLLALVFVGVVAAGPVTAGVESGSEWVLGQLGVRVGWATLGETALCLPALLIITIGAWWLGRRMPIRWAESRRFGSTGSAAVAPIALAAAFAAMVIGAPGGADLRDGTAVAVSLSAGSLAWILLTSALAVAVAGLVVRGYRLLAAALAATGTPWIVELATAAAVLPATLHGGASPLTALTWAPALASGRAWTAGDGTWYGSEDAVPLLNATGTYPVYLLLFTGLALGFGVGAARPGRRAAALSGPTGSPSPPARTPPMRSLPPAAVGAGLVAMMVGLFSWAYTLAVLTPAMPLVGQSAPMPGGDTELYMWVAELRWGSIMLAAVGLLLATADRRAAPLAAVVHTVVLLAADALLARADATGAGGMRMALIATAVAAVLAWWIAGARRRRGADALTARRRLAGVAIASACCGPILLAQGTPAVNHPFLPVGLAGVTAVLPAMLAVVAGCAAAAARPVPLTRTQLVVLVTGPALLLGACGAATGAGVPYEATIAGVLFSGPMTALAVGVMWVRRHRQRLDRIAIWTGLIMASPLAGILITISALILSMFAANILFSIAGSSWQADGLSLLPGAVVLAAPIAAIAARWLVRPADPAGAAVPAGAPSNPRPEGPGTATIEAASLSVNPPRGTRG
jgi:hypothetical protein